MPPRLPSLSALRAFEAAARHLSFTRAAAELHVTQAAVSHQIKSLEDQLGLRLFTRANRALVLTKAGAAYSADVKDAFERLARATERLVPRSNQGILTISLSSTMAGHWLVARLSRFRALHPEINVRLNVTGRYVDLQQEDVDFAIRIRRGDFAGLHAELLAPARLVAVCSPRLLRGGKALRAPGDLAHHQLLREPEVDWSSWLIANGVADPDTTRCLLIDDHGALIDAAVAGQGVALARDFLVADKLSAGTLVQPLDLKPPPDVPDFDYYLVSRDGTEAQPKMAAFRNWILAEAASVSRAAARPRAGNKAGRAAAAARKSAKAGRAPARDGASRG